MGRLTDFTYQHPDKFLAGLGGVGGFVVGVAHLNLLGGLAAALGWGLFTYVISQYERHPPEQGPQQ